MCTPNAAGFLLSGLSSSTEPSARPLQSRGCIHYLPECSRHLNARPLLISSCRLFHQSHVCKGTTQFVKHDFAIPVKSTLITIVHTPHYFASDLASCFRPCIFEHKYFAARSLSGPTHLVPLHEVEEGRYASLDECVRSTQLRLCTVDRTRILLGMAMSRSTISEEPFTPSQGPALR